MKIVIIGPGIMPIPPLGWGAVEALIWDYGNYLKDMGHSVHIINTNNRQEIIRITNEDKPDIVHLQYDEHIDCLDKINAKVKIATSHYGYLSQENIMKNGGYINIFNKFVNNSCYIFALSQVNMDMYIKYGVKSERMYVMPNGANENKFRYSSQVKLPNKSIYLAKIEERKKQYKYQNLDEIDFAGNLCCSKFNPNNKNYLGEWTK